MQNMHERQHEYVRAGGGDVPTTVQQNPCTDAHKRSSLYAYASTKTHVKVCNRTQIQAYARTYIWTCKRTCVPAICECLWRMLVGRCMHVMHMYVDISKLCMCRWHLCFQVWQKARRSWYTSLGFKQYEYMYVYVCTLVYVFLCVQIYTFTNQNNL